MTGSEMAINVEGLGKRYRIGRAERYRTLRESLVESLGAPVRFFRRAGRAAADDPDTTLWALKDVSFQIAKGEVVGVIGRNGAGKSTLLRVMSRITEPTTGRAVIRGRVGSLLEVGTGFHPELTGRENIYMNGAILGMQRAEVRKKFDAIVQFAEVDRFLDTPVKRYSSGMYMRLAFAVAAHLEPEILIVDEVLAVGDAAFQKKCLGRMGDIAREGRTVLFVSHNMGAINALCNRCIMLQKGQVTHDGRPADVTTAYQTSSVMGTGDTSDLTHVERYGNGKARFTSIKIKPLGPDGTPMAFLQTGQDLLIELRINASKSIAEANVALIIYDSAGLRLIDANSAIKGEFLTLQANQEAEIRFKLANVLLRPSLYLAGLWLGRADAEDIDGITYATSFAVEPDPTTMKHPTIFPGFYQCAYSYQAKPLPSNSVE